MKPIYARKKNCFCQRLMGCFALMYAVWGIASAASDHDGTETAMVEAGKKVIRLEMEGAIGPALDNYVRNSLDQATKMEAVAVIIRMDTPGGILTSTRSIIRSITEATLPVIVYVAPEGARASSAGTFILYASHVAAMAPGTHVGAATPVQFGSGSPLSREQDPENAAEAEDEDAMERKIISDTVAYIRALAELRGRNADWAEKAVREGDSIIASEALRKQVIDVMAADWPTLLDAVDGMIVTIEGEERELSTSGLNVVRMDPDWRTRLLSILTNPNVAYVLMLLGIYGLMMELANPGELVPGITGVICLILALFSFHLLPVNYAGMALIILGIALMTAEAFAPSFGVLGIGGGIAFVAGSIMLIDTDAPGFVLYRPLIAVFTLISAIFFIFIFSMALKAWRHPVVSGRESIQGGQAVALNDFDREGRVRLQGESWKARTRKPVRKGQILRVTQVEDLILVVEPETENRTEETT